MAEPALYPSLVDRVVIVTGGGRGLGMEMALALIEAGARVAITAAREPAELAAVRDQAETLAGPGRLVAIGADVRDYGDCERAVAETLAAFGRVHCLVNNAGRGLRLIRPTFVRTPLRFWEASPQAAAEIVDTNVNGPFNMARAVTPHLVGQGYGKIVNISTSLPTMVRAGFSPYGPSKAALEAMSRIWASDLAGTGVTVNVLLPGGASDTRLLPDAPDRRGADGQLLSPALMRAPILWLCADESDGHTGERYIAKGWDQEAPPDTAAAKAREPKHDLPGIM